MCGWCRRARSAAPTGARWRCAAPSCSRYGDPAGTSGAARGARLDARRATRGLAVARRRCAGHARQPDGAHAGRPRAAAPRRHRRRRTARLPAGVGGLPRRGRDGRAGAGRSTTASTSTRCSGSRSRTPLRAVYVTPHHQYPTTVTLKAARRLALLALARANALRHHRGRLRPRVSLRRPPGAAAGQRATRRPGHLHRHAVEDPRARACASATSSRRRRCCTASARSARCSTSRAIWPPRPRWRR